MKIDGKCHCGQIQYDAEIDPKNVAICHCTDCQVLSASAFRIIGVVPAEKFSLKGRVKKYIKTGDSGNRRQQAFCPDCGTGIYAAADEKSPEIFNIRLGTARQRQDLMPQKQIWWQSKIGWLSQLDGIKKIEKQ